MNEIITKKCSACGETKPIEEFEKRKKSLDGYRGKCKLCRTPVLRASKLRYRSNPANKEKEKEYRKSNYVRDYKRVKEWVSKNRDKVRAFAKAYYLRNIEEIRAKGRTEEKKKQNRAWYSNNREKKLKQNHQWLNNNKDRVKETNKKWIKEHPEKATAYRQNRRAMVSESFGKFTAQEWKSLCDKFGNICLCCKKHVKLEADHIVPLIKGGSNMIDNIQPLCRSCNAKKHINIIDYR